MKEIVTQNLWDVLVTLNIKYRIIVMVEWCILMIHGLVYDFMVANLSCCCWEYYVNWWMSWVVLVNWFLDDDVRCGWDDVLC